MSLCTLLSLFYIMYTNYSFSPLITTIQTTARLHACSSCRQAQGSQHTAFFLFQTCDWLRSQGFVHSDRTGRPGIYRNDPHDKPGLHQRAGLYLLHIPTMRAPSMHTIVLFLQRNSMKTCEPPSSTPLKREPPAHWGFSCPLRTWTSCGQTWWVLRLYRRVHYRRMIHHTNLHVCWVRTATLRCTGYRERDRQAWWSGWPARRDNSMLKTT